MARAISSGSARRSPAAAWASRSWTCLVELPGDEPVAQARGAATVHAAVAQPRHAVRRFGLQRVASAQAGARRLPSELERALRPPWRAAGDPPAARGGRGGQQRGRGPVLRVIRQHAPRQFRDRGGQAVLADQRGVAAELELAARAARSSGRPRPGWRPGRASAARRRARRRRPRSCRRRARPGRQAAIGRLDPARLVAGGRRGPGAAERHGGAGAAWNRLLGRIARWVSLRAAARQSAARPA